jgi:predicted GH43/DUF377 family glycosyl hydrolase
MKWKKLGHIYQPSGIKSWSRTHAANPVAEHIEDDYFRIYFSTRDDNNRSSIGYVIVNINEPSKILEESQEPVLMPGDLGMFDDCGVSIGCIVPSGNTRYLYYMGWNLSVTVPWKNTIGLAISESPGQPFKRYSRFPVIGLDEVDPYTISYPWVIRESSFFRMWYGSNLKWGPQKSDMLHVIKYAESDDGIYWKRENRIVINSESLEEYAICKPCVLKDESGYWMWFCSRGDKYRIHIAISPDGINWERLGQDPGIDVSESGWDSEMIEYPCVFDHKGHRYMLYAGNGYGRTGFGIAVLETT